MKKLFAFLIVLILAACVGPGEEVQTASTTTGQQVTTLFHYEGCTVYRFRDAGRYVYYFNCGGNAATPVQIQQGKSTVTRYLMAAGGNHE